jgi:hypothetical protein
MANFFNRLGKGIKKVASVANPIFGAAYDVVGGKSVKDAAKNAAGNFKTGQHIGLKVAPLAIPMAGGLSALPGVGSVASKAAGIAKGIPGADQLGGLLRGALGGKPVTIGNVTSALTGGDGGIGDVAKLLGTLGIGAAGLKAGHDATKRAHELQKRQVGLGDEMAQFGRASLASAGEFRDAAQGPLLMRVLGGPSKATDFSRFADTRNPYRSRYGGTPMLPPPGGR